jgi:multidrug efflux system outer membrane protein
MMAAARCIGSMSLAMLTGCNLAPAYDPPHFVAPDSYQGGVAFHVAQPDDGLSSRGDWWVLFNDPRLNELEKQLMTANPTLQAAAETYTQARALAAEAESGLYPQVAAQAQSSYNRESAHRLFGTSPVAEEASSNQIGAAASWEPDFWDAIRNSAHAQKRLAQASAADLAAARLSLQAELANDYIAVRGLDAEREVLRATIER